MQEAKQDIKNGDSKEIIYHQPFLLAILSRDDVALSMLTSFAPRSSDSMSPNKISCSGRKKRLPGLPVVIEKFAVVGDMLAADAIDLFA